MSIFVVNRVVQFSLGIPRRALLSSWRDYNSAIPVKHSTRGCLKDGKTQKFTPLERCEKRETSLFRNGVSNRGREERSLGSVRYPRLQSSGDGSSYEISSSATEPEYGIMFSDSGEDWEFEDLTGSEMYPTECEFIEKSENALSKRDKTEFNKAKDDAEKVSIELLATRSFTAVDLGKKLRGKKYPPNVIESVIIELKSRGLLNDGLYAESFTQSRWLSSSWGPRRIKRALLQKGVSEADIDKATNLVFKDGDTSSGPEDTHLGISKISMDRLFVQATKQWLRGQNASLENRRSRMVRWLQYRGFNWGITNFILKKLESNYPS